MTDAPKVVTPEEVAQIKKMQETFAVLGQQYGNVAFQELALRNAKTELEKQLAELESAKKGFTEQLQQKYGNGQINLDTGEFIPTT